jgi:hypothetical protein
LREPIFALSTQRVFVAPPIEEPARGNSPVQAPTWRQRLKAIPLSVLAGALGVGLVAVALTSTLLDSGKPATPTTALDTARGDAALDFRWRAGRMDDGDCVGTFELTSGPATPARLVASVIDSSGAAIASDSAQVASTVRGLSVDFRFRGVNCDRISDWQMQVMTPKARAN